MDRPLIAGTRDVGVGPGRNPPERVGGSVRDEPSGVSALENTTTMAKTDLALIR